MPPRGSRVAVLLVLAALMSAGCGDDQGGSGGGVEPAAERAETRPPRPEPDPRDTHTKPAIDKPSGTPPRRLVKEDIVKGKGPAAKPGDSVTVHYVGVAFSTGEEFEASWDAGHPYSFPLGAGRVIAGWDKGLVGMREGGRRQLTIPPEQAYGAEGAPPDIGPNETLVFVVDLVAIK